MAEVHLDHPGEISWFAGQGPAAVIGPCPHDCPHDMTANIAWGPDYAHYTLNACTVPDGCNSQCRAWAEEWPDGVRERDPSLPRYRLGKFLLVDKVLVA